MKENSIEEDIKWIEKIIKKCDDCGLHECIACEICWTEVQAIKHVLKDYKKLQEEFKQVDHECERLEEKEVRLIKENEQLQTEVNSLKKENEELKERIREYTLLISPYYVKENYIPIQKIKDKIEKLEIEEEKYRGTKYFNSRIRIKNEISVLQELLEK